MALHSISFSPRVLYESLGYKIIEVDSIAFIEQIKNSYDAKAKEVILDFSDYNNCISILDNGIGMNENDLKENWLLVGTNNKKLNKNALGGKGIGRFSLFRIANTITIISKKKNCNEYKLILKKEILEELDTIDNLKIEIIENKIPEFFINSSSSGTKIILTDLNSIDFYEIYYDLYNLIQPNSVSNFPMKITYKYPQSFTEPYIMPITDALKYAPFICKASFKQNNLIEYVFTCEINGKVLYKNNDVKKLASLFTNLQPLDLGKIEFYLYNFYFDNKFINLLSIPKNQLQNNFLNVYQGIWVYREGFKIYGHGKDADWLGLAEKRVAEPSKKIDNKLSFGYIVLKRPDSDSLEEKTNRESFIRGKEFNYFKKAIELIIEFFNEDRVKSISIMKNQGGKNSFYEVKKLIEKKSNNANPELSITINSAKQKQNNNTSDSHKIKKDKDKDKNQLSSTKNISDDIPSNIQTRINTQFIKPKATYSNDIIIDSSFKCPNTTPEKIKRIIYELQTIKNSKNQPTIYAQALLLRCLIDISTQYIQENLKIKRNKNDLLGNINNVLNHILQNKLLQDKNKHIDELRSLIKKDNIIKYFNGIVHDYDYRTHFEDIKRIWDKFEFYISFCIKQ